LADDALAACIKAEKFNHGQHEQIRHLTPRMKLSIACAIEQEHGLKIDYAKLIEPEDYASHVAGRRIYRSLGKLGKTFVTTNYDAWLDTEIVDNKVSVVASTAAATTTASAPRTRRRIIDVNEFTAANLNQEDFVFHLHGSVVELERSNDTCAQYRKRSGDRCHVQPRLTCLQIGKCFHEIDRKGVVLVKRGF
jgi:hypothetical protein